MLLQFGVEGFLSFEDFQEIYLTPNHGARLKNTRYEDNFARGRKYRPMKSAILFGDNASGKTNLIYAIDRFKYIILNGLNEIYEETININKDFVAFEITILNSFDMEYFYRLKYNREGQVLEERFSIDDSPLYEYENERLKIFKGSQDDKTVGVLEELYSNKSTNTFLVKLRDLFQEEIGDFIQAVKSLDIVRESPLNPGVKFASALFDIKGKELIEENEELVLDILKALDFTIDGIEFRETIDNEGNNHYDIIVLRDDKRFPLNMESQGVKKMIYLLSDILLIFMGKTVIIDELDSSISAKALIRIFNSLINTSVNETGQFIISSHNLQLMSLDMFHDSQLNIIQKTPSLKSIITSISDYDFRSVKKNLEDEFLRGSFGIHEA